MQVNLTSKQFRRLLDLVYIGNWILNATRGEDRIPDYDAVESLLFARCGEVGMSSLAETVDGEVVPSRAFADGGIHEAVMDYEDTVFFDILAEELARRDMVAEGFDADQESEELGQRIGAYIAEFERNGTDNISINL